MVSCVVCPVVFNLWYLLCSTYLSTLPGYLPVWLPLCLSYLVTLLCPSCGVSLCTPSTRYPVVSLPVVPAPGSLPVSFLWCLSPCPLCVLPSLSLLSPLTDT